MLALVLSVGDVRLPRRDAEGAAMISSTLICPHYINDECSACRDARIRLSERRAVLLRVAAELREVAATWTTQHHPTSVTLGTLATKYEREAAEVK
jgi:hypothetical protein